MPENEEREKLIAQEAKRITKELEGCSIFGVHVDTNNISHLIVAAYYLAKYECIKDGNRGINYV